MTKLTLALVSAFPPGRQSLNEYGFHFAKALAEHPEVAQVVVLADRIPGAPVDELDLGPKITVRRVWRFNTVSAGLAILRALRGIRPDGVIYNLQTASFGDREVPAALGLMTPALSRLMGLPSGIIAHNIIAGIDLDGTVLKGQRLRQAIVRAAGRVVTRAMLSASYMTVTLKSYVDLLKRDYPASQVWLVPHGTFDTEDRPMTPFDERPRKIVTMGKFGTYKRLETLLAAFDRVRDYPQFADYQLVIGGSDHPAAPGYMDSLAAARAGDSGVRFAGYVAEDDIAHFFGSARVCVFDYQTTTGSSGVLHQIASYGAVPVFSRFGDFIDLCEDEGLSGLHYAPGDTEGMAQAIIAVLENPEAADQIARANLRASKDMPLSEVAAFHVARIAGSAALRKKAPCKAESAMSGKGAYPKV